MPLQLTIVCDNTVGRPSAALGEHGFACLLETAAGTWLLDTGRGATLLGNLEALDRDPAEISGVVLSHGHFDHAGGLLPLLERIGPRPVYAHPQIFERRYWQGLHERREIGCPWTRAEAEQGGARFIWVEALREVDAELVLSGPIPRRHPAETGDSHLVCDRAGGQQTEPDPCVDDLAVAVPTSRGLVVVLGCAHAGLINTVEHFRHRLATPVRAIIGGTHLGPAGDEQFAATLDYLDRLPFERLGVAHCTGPLRSAQLHARYPNKVVFANVGTTLEFA